MWKPAIVWKRQHFICYLRLMKACVGRRWYVWFICIFVRPGEPYLGGCHLTSSWIELVIIYSLIVTQFRDRYIQVKDNEIVGWGSLKVTASVIYRWPLYAGQHKSKYKGRFLGSCSVTVIHGVTAIYRAVIHRLDCIRFSLWNIGKWIYVHSVSYKKLFYKNVEAEINKKILRTY